MAKLSTNGEPILIRNIASLDQNHNQNQKLTYLIRCVSFFCIFGYPANTVDKNLQHFVSEGKNKRQWPSQDTDANPEKDEGDSITMPPLTEETENGIKADISHIEWGKPGRDELPRGEEEEKERNNNETPSLHEFYANNKSTIDKMARVAGGGSIEDMCGSTMLVPWILYASNSTEEAWDNIRILLKIKHKHGRNWSIILEELIKTELAEKIHLPDILNSIPEETILTYDGTQSTRNGKLYGHVEMTLASSTLEQGHFYFGEESHRAGGSASSRINIQGARSIFQNAEGGVIQEKEAQSIRKTLGGLIGAYRIKKGVSPREVLIQIMTIDIRGQQKDIPSIILANYIKSTPDQE